MFGKIKEVYFYGWQLTKQNLFFMVGLLGGVYLFLAALTYLSSLAIGSFFMGIVTFVLNVFFLSLFFLGLSSIALKLVNKEEFSIKDMYRQWNQVGNIFLSYLIMFFSFMFIHYFFVFFGARTVFSNLFALMGLLLLFVVYLLFFSFINFTIVKHQLKPIKAIQYNFYLVKRNILFLVLFYAFYIGINLAGSLVFYIGLIITLPITFLAQAYLYELLE